jgi:hypothetical protein
MPVLETRSGNIMLMAKVSAFLMSSHDIKENAGLKNTRR